MLLADLDVVEVEEALASAETIEEYEDGPGSCSGGPESAPSMWSSGWTRRPVRFRHHDLRGCPERLGRELPNKETAMKCPLCRNGEFASGTADATMSHQGVTVVVRGVPADVCDNCGEEYFDADVTQRLLDIAREAAAAGVVVDVRNYVAA